MDITSMIISYESGTLTDVEVVELFAELIKSGLAWRLQGHYGRTAKGLIDARIISVDGVLDYDMLADLLEQ